MAPDIVLANPPFTLKLPVDEATYRSEETLLLKAAEFVKPGGIVCMVLPNSLFRDSFQEKSRIRRVERFYRPLCQIVLDERAFAPAGVSGLEAGVLALQRRRRALREEFGQEPPSLPGVPE